MDRLNKMPSVILILILLLTSCKDKSILLNSDHSGLDLEKLDGVAIEKASATLKQLQYYGFAADGNEVKQKYDWKEPGIFSRKYAHPEIVQALYKTLLEARTRFGPDMRDSIRNSDLQYLLSSDLKQQYQSDLRLFAEGKAYTMGDYANVLYLLATMQPQLEDLLSKNEIGIDDVKQAYVTALKAEKLENILEPLISDENNAYLIKIIFNSQDKFEKAKKLIATLHESGTIQFSQFRDSIAAIKKYYADSKIYNDAKKELQGLCPDLASELNQLNQDYLKKYHNSKNKFDNCFSDLLDLKRYQQAVISSSGADYVDLQAGGDQRFRIRIRFRSGTFVRLTRVGAVSGTDAEVYLVYTIHNGKNLVADDQPDNLKNIHAHIDSLGSEISLGLRIQDINISLDSQNRTKNLIPGIKGLPIRLTLPDVGIWSRYKYDPEKLAEVNQVLTLNSILGIKFTGIDFDQVSWRPHLNFSWSPAGPLQAIKDAASEFTDIDLGLDEISNLYNGDFRHTLNRVLVNKICTRIENAKTLQNLTKSISCQSINYIKIAPLSESDDRLSGEISVKRLFIPFIDHVPDPLLIKFRYDLQNGHPAFIFENINLAEQLGQFRSKIKPYIERLSDHVSANLPGLSKQQLEALLPLELSIEALYYDPSSLSILISVNGKQYRVTNGPSLQAVLQDILQNYLKANGAALRRAALDRGKSLTGAIPINLPPMPKCDDLLQKEISYFGIIFKITHVEDCAVSRAIFTASFNAINISGLYDHGKFSITGVDKQQIIKQLEGDILQQLALGNLIYFRDIRIEDHQLIIPVWCKINAFGFDEMVFEVKVAENGKIEDVKTPLKSILSKRLNDFIGQHHNELTFDGLPGLTVALQDVDLDQQKIVFAATATFYANISVSMSITVDMKTGKVAYQVTDNPLAQIQKYLINGLLGGLCSNSDIKISAIDILKMQITVTCDIKLFSSITLPSVNILLKKDKIDIDFRPKFTLPIVVPIVPPIVSLIDPSVELNLDQKDIIFHGVFAPGVSEAVRGLSNLIKVNADLNAYYGGDIGKITFNGQMIIVDFIPLLNSTGLIDIPKRYTVMEQGTTGPLSSVLKFKQKSEFKQVGDSFVLTNTGELNILDIAQANLGLAMTTSLRDPGAINIDGSGDMNIPLCTLSGVIGTTLTPNIVELLNKESYLRLEASTPFKVGAFSLGDFKVNATMYNADVDFKVGPMSVGASLPSVRNITSDEILKRILAVFGSIKNLPKALLHFMTHPKISIGTPFGSGDDSKSTDGDEGGNKANENDKGGGQNNSANVADRAAAGAARLNAAGVGQGSAGTSPRGDTETAGKRRQAAQRDSMKGKGGGQQAPGGGIKQQVPPAPEPLIGGGGNAGDSKLGFTIMKFSDLDPKNSAIFGRGLLEQIYPRLMVTSPHLLDNTYCIVEIREFPPNVLIYGFIKETPQLDEMYAHGWHFFLVPYTQLRFNSDEFSFKFGTVDDLPQGGKRFSATANPEISFTSPDGSVPYYNLFLGYKGNEVYALTSTYPAGSQFDLPVVDSSIKMMSLIHLYREKKSFTYYDPPTTYAPASSGQSNAKFQSVAGGFGYALTPIPVTAAYCFQRNTGLFGGFHELEGRTDNIKNLPDEYRGEIDSVKRLLKRKPDSYEILVLKKADNKLVFEVDDSTEMRITYGQKNPGKDINNTFKAYMDLTARLQVKADGGQVIYYLNGCNNIALDDIQGTLDNFRKNGVPESNLYRLMKYLSKVFNNHDLNLNDVCISIPLPEIKANVYPETYQVAGKEEFRFITTDDRRIRRTVSFPHSDLSDVVNLNKSTLNDNLFNNNLLLKNLFLIIYQEKYDDELYGDNLGLLGIYDGRIAWVRPAAEDASTFGFVTVGPDSAKFNNGPAQIYFSSNKMIGEGVSASFYDKTALFDRYGKIKEMIPLLLKDSLSKIVIDRLNPRDPLSPLLIYVNDHSNNMITLWINDKRLSISTRLFNRNLNLAVSKLQNKEVNMDKPRIRDPKYGNSNDLDRARFIFDGLRGIGAWYGVSKTVINPLFLFNRNFR